MTSSSAKMDDSLMLVGGELVPSVNGDWLTSIDPATEEVLGRVPAATAADVARAVEAGERAFHDWSRCTPNERAETLRTLAGRILEDGDRLAELDARDTGNTIGVARADVRASVEALHYYAGLAHEAKGETVPISKPGVLSMSLRRPYGVVGRILPFNHPLMFAASKLAAPLAAGNAIVIKPSEQSPLSSLALAEICRDVLPAGVVNIVTGLGADAGNALVRHPRVRRLAFIGSLTTGTCR